MLGDIIVQGLSRQYSDGGGLRGVDAHFKAGELTCVIGPSGSGKTTLLRLLAGLEEPDMGQVLWDGAKADERAPRRSMVFQQPKLLPHLSVAANIALPLTIRDGSRFALLTGRVSAGRMVIVRELAKALGIGALIDRDVRTLSGGEAQRVALARALAAEADVYLFDEPLAAVDERQRAEFSAMLREVIVRARERTRVIFYVTHDLEEAFSLADKVAVIVDGRLEQFDSAETVFRKPASIDVASFICRGALWQLRGVLTRAPDGSYAVRSASQCIPLGNIAELESDRIGTEVTVAIRGFRVGPEAHNSIGRVISLEGFVPHQRVAADLMGERVTLPLVHRAPGAASFVYIDAEDVLFFC